MPLFANSRAQLALMPGPPPTIRATSLAVSAFDPPRVSGSTRSVPRMRAGRSCVHVVRVSSRDGHGLRDLRGKHEAIVLVAACLSQSRNRSGPSIFSQRIRRVPPRRRSRLWTMWIPFGRELRVQCLAEHRRRPWPLRASADRRSLAPRQSTKSKQRSLASRGIADTEPTEKLPVGPQRQPSSNALSDVCWAARSPIWAPSCDGDLDRTISASTARLAPRSRRLRRIEEIPRCRAPFAHDAST